MKRKTLILIIIGMLLFATSASYATDLRGRIDGRHPYAPYPFPLNGARIDLYAMSPRGWILIRTTFTGPDGMYYLARIGAGQYNLQVNGILNFPLFVNNQAYQDIPPILFQ